MFFKKPLNGALLFFVVLQQNFPHLKQKTICNSEA